MQDSGQLQVCNATSVSEYPNPDGYITNNNLGVTFQLSSLISWEYFKTPMFHTL